MQDTSTPLSKDAPPAGLTSLQALKDYDNRRPSFPGEHWLVLGAGLALLMASRRSRSFVKRSAGSALGSALLYRAASGRDGLARVLPYLPLSGLGRR